MATTGTGILVEEGKEESPQNKMLYPLYRCPCTYAHVHMFIWTCITISCEEGNLKENQIWMVLLNENRMRGFMKTAAITLWSADSILKGPKSLKRREY